MSLMDVIAWKWPGARVVIRDEVLERWDGPMAQPTPAELTQAQTDFAADPFILADTTTNVYYKDKNVLAMCAVILEKVDPAFAPGGTDTNAQQRTKVVAAAVRFNQRRKWVERNFALMSFPANP